MRLKHLLALLAYFCFHLSAFELEGNPRSWSKQDFAGFDRVGDCSSSVGDISSVFIMVEDNQLYLRVTFDDMYSRDINVDYFSGEDIQITLKIMSEDAALALHDKTIAIDKTQPTLTELYYDLGQAILQGDLEKWNQHFTANAEHYVKLNVCNVILQTKMVAYWVVMQRIWIGLGRSSMTTQYQLNNFIDGLVFAEGSKRFGPDDAVCIMQQLIFIGAVKGYMSATHEKLVLAKKKPFVSPKYWSNFRAGVVG